MKHFVLPLCLAGVLAAVAAPPSESLTRVEDSIDAMGTTYVVVAYGSDPSKTGAAVQESLQEAVRLDRLLSNYRADSEISEINRSAASRPVEVSDEVFQLLAKCLEYSRESQGAFDITVGPLMKIWGFYKGSGHFPHGPEIRGAMTKVGYRHIQLDRNAMAVRFDRSGVEIDPGGIGKGYAVERMAAILRGAGVDSALISAGTSTMYAIASPPGEDGWAIKIRHPKEGTRYVREVRLRDVSMSTSGSYEKFFWARGRMNSHIMDPRTGYPAQGVLSATVIAPAPLDSEAWTKPLYIDGRKWAATFKVKGFQGFLCEDRGQRSEPACALLQ
jgi:thiamine biosynthesis lipoprotein